MNKSVTIISITALLGASTLVLGGCSTVEELKKPKEYANFNKPEAPVPQQLPSGGAYAPLPDIAQKGVNWQSIIHDNKLETLINQGLANNRDVKAAIANIEMARNLYLEQKSSLKPTVNGGSSIANTSLSDNSDGTNYALNLAFSSYELDFFGRVKALTQSQYENYVISKYDLQTARLALVGEIANAYITLAGDMDSYKLSKKTEAANIRTLQLTQTRYKAGLISKVDVHQAQTTLSSTRADLAASITAIEQDKNALALLIGQKFDDALLPTSLSEIEANIGKVPVGLSSEVLLARPDVVASEHNLMASAADIDAARAALFPKITLTSALGFASDALGSLIKGNAFAFSNTIALTQNIYGGTYKYALAYSQAQREKNVTQYEKSVQTAFKEVSDALARYATIDDQLKQQQSVVGSSQESLRLTNIQYKSGLTSFLSVLDSERTTYTAQKSLISIRVAKLNNVISLYSAIGSDTSLASDDAANVEGAK